MTCLVVYLKLKLYKKNLKKICAKFVSKKICHSIIEEKKRVKIVLETSKKLFQSEKKGNIKNFVAERSEKKCKFSLSSVSEENRIFLAIPKKCNKCIQMVL